MIGSTIPLSYMVGVQGTAAAQGAIRGFTGDLERSRAAIGRPLNLSGWLRPLAGVGTALSGIGRMATGVLGGLGMAGGVMGFTSLVKESSVFNEDLVSLQATLGETDERMASLRTRMEDLAVATGRSRVELLAAARAGTDYGLSLDEVETTMEDLDALARVMKVSPETLMRGAGGLRKLAGDDVSPEMLRTMLFEGQQASGMPEEAFLDMVGKMAPQLSGVEGLEGQEGVAFLMSQLAALGEIFATQPKKLKTGLDEMIRVFRDPQYKDTFADLGINTEDVATAQIQLVTAMRLEQKEVEKLPQSLRDFLVQIMANEGAMDRLEGAHNSLTGDLTDNAAELQRRFEDIKNQPTWEKLMERFKRPLLEAADSVFSWVVGHMPQIQAVFATLGVMISWAVTKLADFGSALVTAWKWVKDNIGEPVAEELAGGSGIMRVAKDAAMQYEYATPRERKNLEDRDRMLTSGSPAEYLLALRDVRESDNPAYEAAPRNDSVGGALNQAMSQIVAPLVNQFTDTRPVVHVTIERDVDAHATFRSDEAVPDTMVGPAGG